MSQPYLDFPSRISPSRRKNYSDDEFEGIQNGSSEYMKEENFGENNSNEDSIYDNHTPDEIVSLYKSLHTHDFDNFLEEESSQNDHFSRSIFSSLDSSYSDLSSNTALANSSQNDSMNFDNFSENFTDNYLQNDNKIHKKCIKTGENENPLHLDINILAKSQNFDSDEDSSRIPPRLQALISDPKSSLTYIALCGDSIVGYQRYQVTEAIKNMKRYLKQCIELGYIEESSYIEDILNKYKEEKQDLDKEPEIGATSTQQEKLNSIIEKRDQNFQKWENKKALISANYQIDLKTLELKYKDSLKLLNDEWHSPNKQKQFNKPSEKLISLRKMAKKYLQMHKFELASQYQNQINEQEKKEVKAASFKMKQAYQQSKDQLMKKYKNEKEILQTSYQTKIKQMEKMKEIDMMKYNIRINTEQQELKRQEKLENSIERSLKLKSRKVKNSNSRLSQFSPGYTIYENQKLPLPTLNTVGKKNFHQKSPKFIHNSTTASSKIQLASLPPQNLVSLE